jgi:hypothetical protein
MGQLSGVRLGESAACHRARACLTGHWVISDITPMTLPDSRAKPCQP